METQVQEHLLLLCFVYGCVWCVHVHMCVYMCGGPYMFVQVKKLVEA